MKTLRRQIISFLLIALMILNPLLGPFVNGAYGMDNPDNQLSGIYSGSKLIDEDYDYEEFRILDVNEELMASLGVLNLKNLDDLKFALVASPQGLGLKEFLNSQDYDVELALGLDGNILTPDQLGDGDEGFYLAVSEEGKLLSLSREELQDYPENLTSIVKVDDVKNDLVEAANYSTLISLKGGEGLSVYFYEGELSPEEYQELLTFLNQNLLLGLSQTQPSTYLFEKADLASTSSELGKSPDLLLLAYKEDGLEALEKEEADEEVVEEEVIEEEVIEEEVIEDEVIEDEVIEDEIIEDEVIEEEVEKEEEEEEENSIPEMELFSSMGTYALGSSFTPPQGNYVISTKKSPIVPGVTETEYIYNNPEGSNPVSNFLVDINLSEDVKIMAASKDYNRPGTQNVMQMVAAAERHTGRNIVAAINADLNWTGTGLSNGPLIIDGHIYSDKPGDFFGIKKDGTAVIAESSKFNSMKNDLEHAINGMGFLVKEGNVVNFSGGVAPRTAVGVRADGSVFFHVVEGRIFPRSVGISLGDLAQIMKDYGAVWALNLDGGGSTTYLAKREGKDKIELRNIPSDGVERPSISSIIVYSTMGDGNFHHTNIGAENDLYTPGTQVQLKATGVDNSGGVAPLPDDLSWALEDESFGSIDSEGLFSSNGKEGLVVIYNKDSSGQVVGEGHIEIRVPDEIHFLNEEYSLGFGDSTDFGLRLTYEQRLISHKDGDIIWEFDPVIGSFTDNIFTSNENETSESSIKATFANSEVSKTIMVYVGRVPGIIFDFEDEAVNEKWEPSGVNGGKTNLSIVHRDSGEPVRFGNYSLRMDYDFTDQTKFPSGAFAGFTDVEGLEELGITLRLPGSPSGVGMWIYATEEVQGVWLRSGIGIEGTTAWKAFNLVPEKEGIDWLGWKYVELDLSEFQGPYTMLPGEFIRLMLTANSMGGNTSKRPVGSIYIDNITVTYGHNPDDVDAPVISSIRANDLEIEEGSLLTSSKVTIETNFYDEEKNSSGMDYDNVNIYVDGINYIDSDYYAIDPTGNKAYLQNVELSDGHHEIKVVVIDNAGNETEERRYLTIDTGTANKTYLEADAKAYINQTYSLKLKSDKIGDIESVYTSLIISDTIGEFNVEFSEAFEGDFEYLKGLRILNINANRISDKDVEEVFTINFPISADYGPSTQISHRVNIGSLVLKEDSDLLNGFSDLARTFNVDAPLKIEFDPITLGSTGEFLVKDHDGKKISSAEIVLVTEDGEEILGKTLLNGKFFTDKFSTGVSDFTIYARKGELLSFKTKAQSFGSDGDESGKPYNITINGLSDLAFSKDISWFSNTFSKNKQALVEYALKDDFDNKGEDALIRVEGNVKSLIFDGDAQAEDNYVVNVNRVNIKDLRSARDYVYRVGNGEVWSEFREFSTVAKYDNTKFLILGDIQTDNYEGIERDLNNISARDGNADFMVQIGDLVDSAGSYSNWSGVLNKIDESGLGDLSMIHVLGNHEFYGDPFGEKAKTIFDLEDGREIVYSGEYGNMYFAVINYVMNEEILEEALQWVVNDSKDTQADWKVLLTHQPPYYSNPQGGSQLFNDLVPSYMEEAGFDFVFSGHDHVYGRTKALAEGQHSEDGVVYVITGALGDKRYTAANNPEFHFDYKNDDFGSLYMTVEIKGDEFTLKAFETSTGEELDSYTKKKAIKGHDHDYYIEGDELVCSTCNLIIPLDGYTGFAKNHDEEIFYFDKGEIQKGLLILGEDIYYLDEKSGVVTVGKSQVWGLDSTFDDKGRLIEGGRGYVNLDGVETYHEKLQVFTGFTQNEQGQGLYFLGGRPYKGILALGEDIYYFDEKTGVAATGTIEVWGLESTFDETGKLIDGGTGFVKKDGETYYYQNLAMVKGWYTIGEDEYYFNNVSGRMYYSVEEVHQVAYIFTPDGKMVKKADEGFNTTDQGTFYVQNRRILHDWQEIDGDTYYFSNARNGFMRTGKAIIGGQAYIFGPDGKLINTIEPGFYKENAQTYYLDAKGSRLHGWQEIDGETYYFSMANNGYMRTGKTKVDGQDYEFAEDGKLIGEIKPGVHKVVRLAGASRYSTATEVSSYTYKKSNFAILASGQKFTDALSASVLAGALDAPILTTRAGELMKATEKELIRLGVDKVFVLGGSAAINDSVTAKIADLGIEVERIAGKHKYDTAALVAHAATGGKSKEAFIVSGSTFADGLAIGAVSAAREIPILLTGETLSVTTEKALIDLGVERVTIIGGRGVVSQAVEDKLIELLGSQGVKRIAGKNRYETALEIANNYFEGSTTAVFARGNQFPDALVGSYLAGKENAPILLVSEGESLERVADYVGKKGIYQGIFLGGAGVISEKVINALRP